MAESKKERRAREEIAQLEIKKRNGMMRAVAAFAGLAVLIAIKVNLAYQGVEWANTMIANGAIFILAVVAAAIAGMGTRTWNRARMQIQALQIKLKK